MKKIIFLILFIPSLSFGQKIVSLWYVEKDTIVHGQNTYAAIKFSYAGGFTMSDTIRIYFNNGIGQPFEVFKMSVYYADTITRKSDGTTWLYYNVPMAYSPGNFHLIVGGSTSQETMYLRSALPDISLKTWSSLTDTTRQAFGLTIDYTFMPTNQDTIKISIGDSVVFKGLYQKAFSFPIPNFNTSAVYNLTIGGYSGYLSINVTKPNHIISGLFDPIVNSKTATRYYNMQGEEIQKPTEGCYIWKSENGASGKSCLVN